MLIEIYFTIAKFAILRGIYSTIATLCKSEVAKTIFAVTIFAV